MSLVPRQFQAKSGVAIFYQFDDPSDVGPAGPPGPQGPIGPTGIPFSGSSQVTGATGPQGAQGVRGPVGATGPGAPTGPTGPQGFNGPQGSAGATGAVGATGIPGPPGASVLGAGAVVGPFPIPTGAEPSLSEQVFRNTNYGIGYFVAVCKTDPRKTIPIKLYGQFQSDNTLLSDLTTCVGNCLKPDLQQTTVNAIDATNFATCQLINVSQGAGANFIGVQLKSFFTGGGEEQWSLSGIPNMVSATPF